MPSYRGSETRRAWDAWAGRTLNRFIAEQMRFLNEDATQQCTVVVNMHVPTWEVAAYARLAEIFLQFAAYVRRAPLPPDLRRHPEIIDVYCAMRDDPDCGRLWVRFEHVAATGLRRCLRTATRLRQDNEWSRRCEQRLNELDQARFPLADEMRPTPDQGLRR